MASDKNENQPENTNKERPVRHIDSTGEDMAEMEAGHLVPGADPPKNEHARGGFGDRDGKTGFGSDSGEGSTAVTVNDDSTESSNIIPDGIPTAVHEDEVDDPIVEMPSTERLRRNIEDVAEDIEKEGGETR